MFQGNWKCSGCGGEITELPFQPRSETGLTCRTCYAKSKGDSGTGASNDAPVSVATTEQEVPDDVPFEEGLASGPQEDDGMESMGATAEKPKFTGGWKCSGCGAEITSLPFEPRNTSNLKCLDCFKKSKG